MYFSLENTIFSSHKLRSSLFSLSCMCPMKGLKLEKVSNMATLLVVCSAALLDCTPQLKSSVLGFEVWETKIYMTSMERV